MTEDYRPECAKTYSKPVLNKGPVLSKIVAQVAVFSGATKKSST
jgi:hypothetical protein